MRCGLHKALPRFNRCFLMLDSHSYSMERRRPHFLLRILSDFGEKVVFEDLNRKNCTSDSTLFEAISFYSTVSVF